MREAGQHASALLLGELAGGEAVCLGLAQAATARGLGELAHATSEFGLERGGCGPIDVPVLADQLARLDKRFELLPFKLLAQ